MTFAHLLESKRRLACFQLPRLLFGGMEKANSITHDPLIKDSNATIWNRTRFESLRWHYHADWDDIPRNPRPKALLDWRAFRTDEKGMRRHRKTLLKAVTSIHRPLRRICPEFASFDEEDQDVAIHHYLGSAERFLARHDVRRTKEVRTKSGSLFVHFPFLFLTLFSKCCLLCFRTTFHNRLSALKVPLRRHSTVGWTSLFWNMDSTRCPRF